MATKVISGNWPADRAAMHIVGPLAKTSNRKQFALVMKDRYSKLARVVLTSKTTAMHITSKSMDH